MATNCNPQTAYNNGCLSQAGVIEFYARSFSSSTVYTYDSTGAITGGTNTTTPLYTFHQRPETCGFDPGEGAHSIENGTVFYTSNLTPTFHTYQATLRTLLYTLALTDLEIFVKTQSGKYFLVGETNGAYMTASKASIGKGLGDLNGATCTFTSKGAAPAREISSAYIATCTFV
jgi:hypothetical protein